MCGAGSDLIVSVSLVVGRLNNHAMTLVLRPRSSRKTEVIDAGYLGIAYTEQLEQMKV